MALHLAARLHAFVHGLFRSSDELETRALYAKVASLFADHGLNEDGDRTELIASLVAEVADDFDIDADHPQFRPLTLFVQRLFDYEGLFLLPEVDWSERHSLSQYWNIRDRLNEQRRLFEKFAITHDWLRLALVACLEPIYEACPALLEKQDREQAISVPTELIRNIREPGIVAQQILGVIFNEELEETGLLARHRKRLEANLIAASGGNPDDPKGLNRAPKWPSKSDLKDAGELVETYLGGTPVGDLFAQTFDFTLPLAARFEHHHIVAGSGHGKTQTLQFLIAKDLEAVAAGKRSIVVIDSQGDLIGNISKLAEFAPNGPLHDRVVIIDPTDVEWPVSLNLFDVGIERMQGYPPLERERLINSILELYDFVLGSLLSAEMTQKQSVIFRYVTRLMLHIPDATIHTLRDLMEKGSHVKFAGSIDKLEGTARRFFETEFHTKEFEQTKKQVLRRLWGILENQTFERMFSHPRSKLDLFAEMNAGKVILINTAKDLLKEQGTEIFGRFFIALIAQAAQERATLPEKDRMPTFVYIDEAADYFDRNIGIILSQARKYAVGMVLAHQYLGQLEPKLQEAFAANTSIKFAGGVSARDARALSQMLGCEASLIEDQPKGHFAAAVRGVTKGAVPLAFPFGTLEDKRRMTREERAALQDAMRKRYAVHYSELTLGADLHKADGPEAAADSSPAPAGDAGRQEAPDVVDTDAKPDW
jgi:hypothetical protein